MEASVDSGAVIALWRELRSFKGDWDRWSVGEKMAATASTLAAALAASVMLMKGL
jgi:hypothetical protein